MKKTNFDRYLEEQLSDPEFADRFRRGRGLGRGPADRGPQTNRLKCSSQSTRSKPPHSCRSWLVVIPYLLLTLLFYFVSVLPADALDVPRWTGYVNDYAGMINAETKARIEENLLTLEKSDTTQIYLLTIPSLEGSAIEDYAIRVFDVWKAGQKGLDNGVILIVAQKERKIRIEVGRGLEGKLTDLEAGRIIDLIMKPRFKAGNYNEGFAEGVLALIRVTRGEFKPMEESPAESSLATKALHLLDTIAPRAERLLEFVFASFILLVALYLLGYFMTSRKRMAVSLGAGAIVLPVAALFTVWVPDRSAPFNSLLPLFIYMAIGAVIGLAVCIARSNEGKSRGRHDDGGGGSSSGSSYSNSSSSSSDSSSGGGGGSSGGGGASGDY